MALPATKKIAHRPMNKTGKPKRQPITTYGQSIFLQKEVRIYMSKDNLFKWWKRNPFKPPKETKLDHFQQSTTKIKLGQMDLKT